MEFDAERIRAERGAVEWDLMWTLKGVRARHCMGREKAEKQRPRAKFGDPPHQFPARHRRLPASASSSPNGRRPGYVVLLLLPYCCCFLLSSLGSLISRPIIRRAAKKQACFDAASGPNNTPGGKKDPTRRFDVHFLAVSIKQIIGWKPTSLHGFSFPVVLWGSR